MIVDLFISRDVVAARHKVIFKKIHILKSAVTSSVRKYIPDVKYSIHMEYILFGYMLTILFYMLRNEMFLK